MNPLIFLEKETLPLLYHVWCYKNIAGKEGFHEENSVFGVLPQVYRKDFG